MSKNETFTKFDTGKLMLSLVDPEYITGTAEVLTIGAAKYTPDNWKKVDDPKRYVDALLRHIYAWMSGETLDPETAKSHLMHASCNLMFLYHFDRNQVQDQVIQHTSYNQPKPTEYQNALKLGDVDFFSTNLFDCDRVMISESCARNGHIDLLKFVHETLDASGHWARLIEIAVENKQYGILEWILREFNVTWDDCKYSNNLTFALYDQYGPN